MSTELELKFLMDPAHLTQFITALPQLGLVQSSDTATLLNAYFDTAEKWFRQHDMGLRSRLKRGQYEQTIKLAGTQHGAMQMRPEYNVPCASVEPVLGHFPDEIWPSGTDVMALQQQLTELFRTDFSRQSWRLLCSDGSIVELVYDQGKVIAGTQQQIIAELEIELVSGNALNVFTMARILLQQLPLRTGWQSKAARGYRLAAKQAIPLPVVAEDTLLAQIQTLQQAEACYEQHAEQKALDAAILALTVLAALLQTVVALRPLHIQAVKFANELATGTRVFDRKDYNLWLLALSEYLYRNA